MEPYAPNAGEKRLAAGGTGGPSGHFNPNYALTTVTTDSKTNVPGDRDGRGSDRLVPGGLIKGDPLGLRGDESCF